jgi:hypothetical protein
VSGNFPDIIKRLFADSPVLLAGLQAWTRPRVSLARLWSSAEATFADSLRLQLEWFSHHRHPCSSPQEGRVWRGRRLQREFKASLSQLFAEQR